MPPSFELLAVASSSSSRCCFVRSFMLISSAFERAREEERRRNTWGGGGGGPMNAEGGEPDLKMPTFFPWPPLFSASPPPQTAALLGSLFPPSQLIGHFPPPCTTLSSPPPSQYMLNRVWLSLAQAAPKKLLHAIPNHSTNRTDREESGVGAEGGRGAIYEYYEARKVIIRPPCSAH